MQGEQALHLLQGDQVGACEAVCTTRQVHAPIAPGATLVVVAHARHAGVLRAGRKIRSPVAAAMATVPRQGGARP